MARTWTAALPQLLGRTRRVWLVDGSRETANASPGQLESTLRSALAPGGDDATETANETAVEIRLWGSTQPDDGASRERFEATDAVWLERSPGLSELETWHRLLPDRARLVVRAVGTTPEADGVSQAVVALSTAGFAVLRVVLDAATDSSWLAARRDPLRVRGYEAGDEASILRLFHPSFHVERSLDHWQWKYLDNPWGGRRISLAWLPEATGDRETDPDEALVGHYAGYPVRFVDASSLDASSRATTGTRRGQPEVWTALQVGDTMTSPRVRSHGRGPTSVLGRLVRHFYASHCTGRVAFNFGFNTGNIRRFSERFVRAEAVEPVTYRRLDADRLERVRAISSGLRVDRVLSPTAAFDRFFARVAPAYGVLLERSAVYLRWRYLTCPDPDPFVLFAARRFGRLAGWAVFRRRGERLLWADALIDPRRPQAADALLTSALAWDRDSACERSDKPATAVEGWFPDRPPFLDRRLAGLGFVIEPEPDDLTLMVVPHELGDTAARLRGRLYYTKGDGDLA